jgi:hypothetical protein
MDQTNFIRRNQMELVKKSRGSHLELIERARLRERERERQNVPIQFPNPFL